MLAPDVEVLEVIASIRWTVLGVSNAEEISSNFLDYPKNFNNRFNHSIGLNTQKRKCDPSMFIIEYYLNGNLVLSDESQYSLKKTLRISLKELTESRKYSAVSINKFENGVKTWIKEFSL